MLITDKPKKPTLRKIYLPFLMELYKRYSRTSHFTGPWTVFDVPIHTSLTQLERPFEDAREKIKREKQSTMTVMGNFCLNIICDKSQF